jgi:hypothetical protein
VPSVAATQTKAMIAERENLLVMMFSHENTSEKRQLVHVRAQEEEDLKDFAKHKTEVLPEANFHFELVCSGSKQFLPRI